MQLYVTNCKRLCSTFCTIEAKYWQTRSIGRQQSYLFIVGPIAKILHLGDLSYWFIFPFWGQRLRRMQGAGSTRLKDSCLILVFFDFRIINLHIVVLHRHITYRLRRHVPHTRIVVNPLDSKGNYSATSNNTKLLHWPLMGGLLHLVQRGGAGPHIPLLAVPNGPSMASVPITVLLYDSPLLCGFNVAIKVLITARCYA